MKALHNFLLWSSFSRLPKPDTNGRIPGWPGEVPAMRRCDGALGATVRFEKRNDARQKLTSALVAVAMSPASLKATVAFMRHFRRAQQIRTSSYHRRFIISSSPQGRRLLTFESMDFALPGPSSRSPEAPRVSSAISHPIQRSSITSTRSIPILSPAFPHCLKI